MKLVLVACVAAGVEALAVHGPARLVVASGRGVGSSRRTGLLQQQPLVVVRAAPLEEGSSASSNEPAPKKKLWGMEWVKAKVAELKSKDRKDIASLGATAFLSYGFVSNVNSVLLVAFTWATFRATNPLLSPLSETAVFMNPLTWLPLKKEFLAYYIGYYATVGTILRPFRFALAAFLTPKFDRVYDTLQQKLRVPKPVAMFLCTLVANIALPVVLLVAAVNAACFLFRVPPVPVL